MKRKIKLLASQLAKHYGPGVPRACACSGLDGICLDCKTWWELFLTHYSKGDVYAMVAAFHVIKGSKRHD